MNLDSCARLHLDRRGRLSSYFSCGVIGGVAGIAVVIALGALRPAASPAAWPVALLALPLFLIAVKVSHIIAGYERIVLYEKLLAVMLGTGLVLHALDRPVWLGLELCVIGVGTFLIAGRVGCLRVGCCHGRPHRWGIVYGAEHGRAGFTAHYVGVRLFPVQLLASLATAALIGCSVVLFLRPHRPGEVVCVYLAGYAVVRWCLELLRGDPQRPYWLGASEAQWLALVTSWGAVYLSARLDLQLGWLYLGAAGAVSLASLVLIVAARLLAGHPWALRQPHRVAELAAALDELGNGSELATTQTTGGLRISFSREGDLLHYGLSREGSTLSEPAARELARQLAILGHYAGEPELVAGRQPGVFHARVHPGPALGA